MSLPLILWSANLSLGCKEIQDSISHYYYIISGGVFVGLLSTVGLFLIAYKGYDKDQDGKADPWDNYLSTAAGIGALGVALFPVNMSDDGSCLNVFLDDNSWRNGMHYVSALVFFVMLSIISYFRFTKSSTPPNEQKAPKKNRNRLYKGCAIAMIICVACIPLADLVTDSMETNSTFWLEWAALIAFGVSWITKGQMVWPDKQVN